MTKVLRQGRNAIRENQPGRDLPDRCLFLFSFFCLQLGYEELPGHLALQLADC
jgi:hypothetical protein